nr:uncharacterized protein LOC109749191 [Aegilops tauschii subsp. strangulata]
MRPTGRRSRTSNKKASTNKTPQSTPAAEPVIQQSGDINRASVTFLVPLSSAQPSASTAQAPADPPSSLFTTHHVPEDEVSAAKEAIRQAGLMMEQMKVVREANQAAYDASSALQANVQRSCELGARFVDLEQKQIQLNLDLGLAKENLQKAKDDAVEKMNQALAKKDLDLAAAQKTVEERTTLADQKLASVAKLEEENTKLKAALDEANRENSARTSRKRLGGLRRTWTILSPVKDEAAMNVPRLESRLASVMDYLTWLKVAMSRIDTTLWPRATLQNDLESLMIRFNEIPSRVQEWKKSSARCGANVALSLVRVHCKEAKEEKLAALKVANTKRLDF